MTYVNVHMFYLLSSQPRPARYYNVADTLEPDVWLAPHKVLLRCKGAKVARFSEQIIEQLLELHRIYVHAVPHQDIYSDMVQSRQT